MNRSAWRLPELCRRAVLLVWVAARRELLLTWLCTIVAGGAVAIQLLLVQAFLAEVVGAHPRAHRLSDVAALVVALALTNALGDFAGSASQERQRIVAELTARHVQAKVLDIGSGVDLATFESPEFHDHLARAASNAILRPYQVAMGLAQSASGLVGTIAIVVALAKLQPWAAAVIVLGGVPLWIATSRNSRALYQVSYQLAPIDRERTYLSNLLTDKDAAKELRAYQLGPFFLGRWSDLYGERIRRIRSLVTSRQRRSLLANAVTSVFLIVALSGLLELVFTGRMSLAAAGAAAVAVQLLAGRVQQLMGGVSLLYECSLFLDDVSSFMALDRSEGHGGDLGLDDVREIILDQVSFAYPGTDRLALDGVSMQLERGAVVAVVGVNGAGKSTLVKLLCGLYQPSCGAIRWDGIDAATIDDQAVRAAVGAVFQDYLRYQLSAASNISVGRASRAANDEAVRAAARAAGADDYLVGLADGYGTVLSRAFAGGTDLSLGQWQRVALARMFFRDAPVVILDEPASALDPLAEHDLFEHVRRLCSDRAVLLISHRLSSVRSADHIYVLDRGRVVEHGPHDTLMEAGGPYSEMFRLQAAAYVVETPDSC